MDLHRTSADVDLAGRAFARTLLDENHELGAPIRAGMRARAIAEMCERLGLPALLIDATGRVLHVVAAAAPWLDGDLALSGGHLIGRTMNANRVVEQAITVAVSDEASDVVRDDADSAAVTGLPYRDPSPYQLLRGVLVLGDADASRLAPLRDLMAA